RPLADVTLVLGSGGVLRHSPSEISAAVLDAVSADHGGGWRVPAAPRKGVDTAYLLFAVGLLADRHSTAAHALAGRIAT
ncbi:MAG TPA: glutamate mutase L, partial [Phycicoccus sp.]|nr:glutamate mutase L [Phycicoccus sp.]